jgi:ribosomal protein S8
MNYNLADFIARLNVAKRKHLKTIIIRPSNLVFSLLKIFEDLGIIRGYSILENFNIEILLKYNNSRSAFTDIKIVSKPSKRVYVNMLKLHKIKEIYAGNILILSTSKGFMLDIECLKQHKGGIVLLRIVI